MNSWDEFSLDNANLDFFNEKLNMNFGDLKNSFQNSRDDLGLKICEVEKIVRMAKENKWDDIKYSWNIVGFILTASLDLKNCGELIVLGSDESKCALHIKNTCTLIYELLEDLEQLLGKNFYKVMDNLNVCAKTKAEFNDSKKLLSKFRREHKSSLKKVRIVVGAHRDHDFLAQLEVLRSLDSNGFMSLVFQFDKIINELADTLSKVNDESLNNFVDKMRINSGLKSLN